jgi:phosphohistidine phosphatase
MKYLLLMRHGKSESNDPGKEDIDRALTPHGLDASISIANWIKKNALHPDIALISSARRAYETWEAVKTVIGGNTSEVKQDELYLANPGDLLEQISNIDDTVKIVILIGHNPGIESLAIHLAIGDSLNTTQQKLNEGFSTGALAAFELNNINWTDIKSTNTKLIDFIRPQDLD